MLDAFDGWPVTRLFLVTALWPAYNRERRMKVTVELQAFLQQYSPSGESVFEHTLPDGATVQTLVRDLHVPEEMASVIVLNGGSADFDDPLSDGDSVIFIPPLSGG